MNCANCPLLPEYDTLKKQRDDLLREVVKLWQAGPGWDAGELAALAQAAFGIQPDEYEKITGTEAE
jgi:hypothetical protein